MYLWMVRQRLLELSNTYIDFYSCNAFVVSDEFQTPPIESYDDI